MIKKTSIIIFLVLIGLVFLYGFNKLKQRQERLSNIKAVQNAKAPEIKITLIEGWSNKDIAEYLEKNNIIKAEDFLKEQKAFDVSSYSKLSQKPKNLDLEGYIFPDTYFIPKSVPSGTLISNLILRKALNNFNLKVTPEIINQASQNNLNLNEFITLASIIEKESGKSFTEKQTIASVFYNRLKIGMPLQSDATVNYVTGKSLTRPLLTDLQKDSLYNTYKYTGLPPGPISNPGLDSINATANPITTNYFYFLSDPITGKAIFSKTHEEHVANKVKYLK